MRALFLNPPYLPHFIRSARSTWPSISGSNWYPIFLAYTAGWLEKHGHQVKLVDALMAGFSPWETVQIAQDFKTELLTLYISPQSLKSDLLIGEKIKKLTSCQLVLVGPWCAFQPEKMISLNKAADGVVRREFDDVILDLAEEKDKREIKGLVYRDGEKIISNQEREFLTPKQLDQFPFVTKVYKEHLPINKYYQASLLHPFVDLFTARGCVWGKCSFCLWPNTIHKGAPYRARNLEDVIEELKFIKRELPYVKEVFLQDDTLPAPRAQKLAGLILKKNLKTTWSCYVRPEIDFETLRLMKKSGCRFLHVGYETADEIILKNICKGTKLETMKKFTENTKRVGLRVHGDFIIGLPGETEDSIKKTIRWAKDLGIEGYQFFLPQPQEGTPLYAQLKKKGYLTQDGNVDYPGLSQERLNRWRFKAMREIYFSPSYVFRTTKNIKSFSDLERLLRTGLHVIPNILKR